MYRSINSLVISKAVNTDVIIPNPKVTEKPLIGPEPKKKRMIAAIMVVTFASMIEDKAFSYPIFIEL